MIAEEIRYPGASPFKYLQGIEYFDFEEEFVERNMRCIPMIIRFKLDAVGIKLKLGEWNRFSIDEKFELATKQTDSPTAIHSYYRFLSILILTHTNKTATLIAPELVPKWKAGHEVPSELFEYACSFGWTISAAQWTNLSDLQRFALLKLCRPGHENKNFPMAMKEFGLIN